MSGSPVRQHRPHTWTEYQTWNDDQRWEIIGGDAYLMSPSPTTRHQKISMAMTRQMAPFLAGKPCQLFAAPVDVVLSEEDVVQPDLLVVCDPMQIKRTHIDGAPSLVVEIISPDSTVRDRRLKLDLYARSDIKEYWIVTPWPSIVEVLLLAGTRYAIHHVVDKEQILVSPSFPTLRIDLSEVFNFPLEPGDEPQMALYQTAAAK